jgi:Arc/MetJ-type ribon-helix-helix transcriptional regulator
MTATVRINFTLPGSEAERFREHARNTAEPGEEPNISAMIRRAVRRDIERWQRSRVREKAAGTPVRP